MSASLLLDTAPTTNVGMGQVAVAHAPGKMQAVLGSCIGLALYHRRLQIGALAHVVLPQSSTRGAAPGKFADTALPHLLDLLDKEGVNASGLVAKLAGGASMFGSKGPIQIGEANATAVLKLLEEAHIRVVGHDLGGGKGRRILFDSQSGDLKVDILNQPPLIL